MPQWKRNGNNNDDIHIAFEINKERKTARYKFIKQQSNTHKYTLTQEHTYIETFICSV